MLTGEQETGRLVIVVGASGVGKDTLLAIAKDRLKDHQDICFPRRCITRPPSAGEDHEPMSDMEFDKRLQQGAFCLHWEAHTLRYGIPAIVDSWLSEGKVVVVNGSRAALPTARTLYPSLIIAKPELIARRLKDRRRESADDQLARVARNATLNTSADNNVETIDNSADAGDAGDKLVELLLGAAAKSGSHLRR